MNNVPYIALLLSISYPLILIIIISIVTNHGPTDVSLCDSLYCYFLFSSPKNELSHSYGKLSYFFPDTNLYINLGLLKNVR